MKLRLVTLLTILAAASAFAQKPAPMELGFQADKVYQFGSIDNVNAFNGNLIVTLPIGLRYPVATGFDYGLTLTYNGKIWDYYTDQPYSAGATYEEGKPNLRSNAGPGWRVSMGRLLAPNNPTLAGYIGDNHPWVYESPAGDEHPFSDIAYNDDTSPCGNATLGSNNYVQFTCDGSHLRMVKINDVSRTVELPDGKIHQFMKQGDGTWRLYQIRDQAGNTVSFTYPPPDGNNFISSCTITDNYGRSIVINYTYFSEMNDSVEHGANVDSIQMTGYGSSVTYKFHYTLLYVPKAPYDTFTGGTLENAPPCATTSPCTIALNMLTSIDLPDSQTPSRNQFHFSYATDPSASDTYSQGLLVDLQLPTGGHHSYAYQKYTLPPSMKCDPTDARNDTPGIKSRTVDGHTWQYVITLSDFADLTGSSQPSACRDPEGTGVPENWPKRWSRTSIVSPPDDETGKTSRTDHYFSVYGANPSGYHDGRLYADNYPGCNCTMTMYSVGYPGVAGWPGATQAKTLAPATGDCAGGHDCDGKLTDTNYTNPTTLLSLTSQTYDGCSGTGDCTAGTLLRTTWTRNGSAKAEALPVISERTTFEDDQSCASNQTCYEQSDKFGSDNFGHWATTNLLSNYPGTSSESQLTQYRLWTGAQATALDSNGVPVYPWVVKYTEKTRTLGGAVDRTLYCFNDSGQIFRMRKLASNDGTNGAHDLISDFTYDGADVSDMKSYGGDYQTVGTGDVCGRFFTLPADPEYWNQYGYVAGVLTSDQYFSNAQTALPFFSLKRTVDAASGLVTSSISTDDLTTAYDYEAWGALKKIAPPGEAPTTYSYTPATYTSSSISSNARVTATTSDAASTYNAVTYTYDGLGRLFKTSRALPGAACAEQIVGYDNNGRRATESTWKYCGAAGGTTTTRYDGLGRVIKMTAPDTKVSSVAYTGAKHIDRTVSVAEKSSERDVTQGEDYDVFGRLIKVTIPLLTGSYQYDVGDRLKQVDVTSPNSSSVQTRTFSYDNRGFLLSETHPELGPLGGGNTFYQHFTGSSVDQGYDSRGHSHYKNAGSAFTLFTTFDKAERVLTVTDGNSVPLKQLAYDSTDSTQCPGSTCKGKLSTAVRTNPVLGTVQTTESYRYDASTGLPTRRDTSVSSTSSFSGLSFVFTQQYNAIGTVKKVTYPCQSSSGNCTDTPLTVGYNYTNALVSSIDDGGAPVATIWSSGITYQPSGLIADVVHGNGKMHEKWSADSAGMSRPGNIVARNGADTSELWSSGIYQYDGAGNIKQIGNTAYVYDDLQQLKSTVNGVGNTFNATTTNYDAFGNILSTTQSFCGSTGRCGSSTALARKTDTTHNHYTDMTYDSAGNVTGDGHRTFLYDALGMTNTVFVSGRTFNYLYDADDERIAIVEPKWGNNRTTWTLRGFGKQLLRSYVDDSFSGTRQINRKEDEIWRGDKLLASDSAARGVRFFVLDHLGSPRYLVKSDGTPIGTQTFSPWGMGGSSDGGLLQFTGHERDSATVADLGQSPDASSADLPDDFHARLYDPNKGQFLSVDPTLDVGDSLAHPLSWNRYMYALNNPMLKLDPDGRANTTIFQRAAAVVRTWADAAAVSAKALSGAPNGVSESASQIASTLDLTARTLNLGTASGQAIGDKRDAHDVAMAVSSDVATASEAFVALGGIADGANSVAASVRRASNAELAEGYGMLREAAQGSGNFGIGKASAQRAEELGKAWVGPNYKTVGNGKILISEDGLRQFRLPSLKPKLGMIQANFESRAASQGSWTSNAHLDIVQ